MFSQSQESRPILDIPLKRLDYILEISGWMTLGVLFLFSSLIFTGLPEIIPSHFSFSGEPNGFSNKWSFLFLPILALFMFVGFTYLGREPHKFNYLNPITPENAYSQYVGALRFLKAAKIFIALLFLIIQLHTVSVASGGPKFFIYAVFLFITIFPLIFFFFTESSSTRA
ncbi:MAG: DUF1648 domain-containing protein [Chloroherpetonaceae bacterium]|nr:DUF1648 domain-containing protein [Chloroherpetonaceae bacterium]